jgi:hypothetical protein
MRIYFLVLIIVTMIATSYVGQRAEGQKGADKQSALGAAGRVPTIYFEGTPVPLGEDKARVVAALSRLYEVVESKQPCVNMSADCWFVRRRGQTKPIAMIGFENGEVVHVYHTLAESMKSAHEVAWNLTTHIPQPTTCSTRKWGIAVACCDEDYMSWTCNGVIYRLGTVSRYDPRAESRVELVQILGDNELVNSRSWW